MYNIGAFAKFNTLLFMELNTNRVRSNKCVFFYLYYYIFLIHILLSQSGCSLDDLKLTFSLDAELMSI